MASSLLRSPNPNVPYSRPMTPVISPKLGFIGIGAMGYMMSRNLANQNRTVPGASPLLVWNRTTARAEKLAGEVGEEKVAIAQSVEQIAKECDIIFTNLGADEAVKSIYEKFAEALHVRLFSLSLNSFSLNLFSLIHWAKRRYLSRLLLFFYFQHSS